MAELDSEDSSDGTLVIDEPNYDNETIEILDDSDSDVEIVELNDDIEDNSDVEVVELDDNVNDNSDVEIVELDNHIKNAASLNPSGLTCKPCSRVFSTNNDLLNHIRKFKGRIGGCTNVPNNTFTKRKNVESPKYECLIKKKRGRPPKNNNVIVPPVPLPVLKPVPKTIPLNRPSIPELIPIIFKTVPKPTIETNKTILPSLSQILVDEIEPEYPCTMCDEVFRHNIALLCHLNTEHNNEIINKKDENKNKKSTKLGVKKQIMKKRVNENTQIENCEPISDTVDLTLLPDLKKDSLMNRMKSYIYTSDKGQITCLLCNIEFKNTKKALAHVEDKHIMDKLECGYCNMKFVFQLKLRSHMAKRHKVIGVYKCDKCSKMINNEEKVSHSEECKGKVNPIIIKKEEVMSNSL